MKNVHTNAGLAFSVSQSKMLIFQLCKFLYSEYNAYQHAFSYSLVQGWLLQSAHRQNDPVSALPWGCKMYMQGKG